MSRMPKFFTENNKSYFELKDDTICLYTDDKNSYSINRKENPIEKKSRIFLKNGDNIGILQNTIYIESLRTTVIVNGKIEYRLFPSFISEDFKEFCLTAVDLKKEKIGESEYVIATFNLDNLIFRVMTPPNYNGYFKFIFQNILPNLTEKPEQNINLLNKFHFAGFETEIGEEKNILILKSKNFSYNNFFRAVYKLSNFDTSFAVKENYTA